MTDRSQAERLLNAAVRAVLPPVTSRPLVAVEVANDVDACSAHESLLVVSSLGRRHVPWRFLWMPTQTGQVRNAARLMAAYSPQLLADVEFVHHAAPAHESPPFETLAPIDFAWIGGSQTSAPATTVRSLMKHLSDGGLALVENPPDNLAFDEDVSGDRRDIRYALVNIDGHRFLLAGAAVPIERLLANVEKLGLQLLASGCLPIARGDSTTPHHAIHTSTLTADALNLATGWAMAHQAFPLVTIDDFARAMAAAQLIEERIVGRHCGDLGDRLAQYLAVVQHVRTSGGRRVDVLEIGTLFGGSCLMNLCAMRDLGVDGKVTCIDPLAGYYSEAADPTTGLPVDPETLYLNLARCGFAPDRIELRRCLSSAPEARAGLAAGSFAMLMIDGDHSADGIRNDWNAFVEYVGPDGTVLIDDYADPVWPDITPIADRLSKSNGWSPVAILGTTLIAQREGHQVSRSKDSPGEPIGDAPSIGLVARALNDDTYATTHWSARLASAMAHLRHWCEMNRQLELGRTSMARGEWSLAEAQLVEVISRKSAAPRVLVRAWLCLADCAEQRRDHARELECLQRAVDVEKRLVAHGHPHLYASNRLRRARAAAPLDRLSA